MEDKAVVLYIDDEYLNLSAFEILFRNKFTVFATHDPRKAFEIVKKNEVDVVIADQKMPMMTGVEILKQITEINNSILRIIHSGYIDDPEIKKAVDEGIAQFILDKPLNKIMMLKMIDVYMESKGSRTLL
ncbi:MAG TPA: response regulator [Spirochaetota bacterium]|nr:response regulator [Spirochaetota bacterium]